MAVKLATGYIDLTVKSKGAMDKIARDIAGVGASGKSAGIAAGEGITAGITGKVQAGLPGVGKMIIGQFARIAAPAAAAFGVGKVLQLGFARLTAIDEAEKALSGLGHSAESVASIMDSALRAVKGTAFGMGEAAGLAGVIVASGVKPGQELDRVLKGIADTAAVVNVPLEQMGDVWAKAAAKGTLDAQTVNSLLAMRIPIYQDLAEVTGKTAAEIAAMQTSGQLSEITFEQLQQAMAKYSGAALKTGETVSGSIKNMNAALSRLGAALLKPVFSRAAAVFQNITKIIDRLGEGVGPAIKKIEDSIANFFKGGMPSLSLGGIVDTSKLGEIVGKIRPLVGEIWTELSGAFAELGPKLASLGGTLFTHLVPVIQTVATSTMHSVHLIMQVFKELAPVVLQVVGRVAEGFEKLAPKLVGVFHAAMPLIERFRGIIAAVMPVILQIIRRVMAVAGEMVPHIANAAGLVIDAIKGIIDAIVAVVDWIERWKEPIAIVAGVIGAMLVPALVKWAAQQVINLALSAKAAITSGIETAAIYGMIIAEKARTIAMTISAGAAKILGVALAAAGGPIGLIIIGITALIAGLVLFFTKTELGRKIWAATWNFIKKAASAAWGFLKGIFSKIGDLAASAVGFVKKHWDKLLMIFGGPIGLAVALVIKHWDKVKVAFQTGWNIIKSIFSTGWQIIKSTLEIVGQVVMWLWQNVITPAMTGIKFAVQVAMFPIKVAIEIAKIAFKALGEVAMWLWQKAIVPAWNAIRGAVAAVIGFLVARFNTFMSNIRLIGRVVMELWNKYVVPAWEGIKSAFSTAWQFILNNVLTPIKDAFVKYIGEPIMGLWNNYVVPAWEKIKEAFGAAWTWIQDILEKIRGGFADFGEKLKSIAGAIKDGVSAAFSGLIDIMKGPIRKLGDILAATPQSAFGVPIPGAGTVKEWGQKLQSLQAGGVAQRTPKGLLRGPGGPRSDSILGVGPDGMPLVRVSPGEGVVAARAMFKGGNRIVAALNAGWVPSADFLHALVPGMQRGGQVSLASLKKGVASEENLQPYTVLMARAVSKAFPQIKSIGGYRADQYEWHPTGRAIDVMIPNYNTPKGKALGDSIASFIVANRRALGLRDFIWRQKFYTAEGKGNAMEDRGSPTQNHMDHLHIVCNYGQPKGGSINIGRGGGGGRAPAGGGRGGGGRAAAGGGRGGARGPGARAAGPTEAQTRQLRGQEQRIGNLQQQIGFQERELAEMEAKTGKGKPTDIQLEKKRAQIDKSRQQLENVESDFAALQAKTGVARGGAAATGAFQGLPEAVPLVQNPDGTWTSPDPAWAALIKRESGGRADIIQQIVDANTGGNEAEGLFQIAKGTWAGAGGREFAPTAGAATPQQQAVVAARIFRTSGGKPWGAGLAGRENEAELAAGLDELGDSLEDASDALGDFGDELEGVGFDGGGGGGGGDGGGKRPWQHEALDELLGKAGEVADIAAGGLVENLPPGFGNPMDWPVMKSISGLFGFFSGLTDDPVAKGLLGMGAAGFAGSPSGMISSIKGMMPKPFGETGGAGTELSPDDFIALGEPIGGSMADAFTGMASDMLPEMGGQQTIDNSIHIGENGTVGQDPAAVDDVARRRGQAQSRAALGGSIGRAYQ